MLKRLLPMAGHTRGNRSAVTCELKCGNACAHPVPNTSANPTFQQIAETAISRRSALVGGTGLAAAVVIGSQVAQAPEALADNGRRPTGGGKLPFEPIAPVSRTVDTMTVPEGYDWGTVIRWGDPLFADSPEFDIEHQTGASQAAQFGYNNDYLNIITDGGNDRSGYLVSNHEYTNENIMFSPEYIASNFEDVVNVGLQAHGLSIVDLKRAKRGAQWEYVRGGRRNRRITGTTEFEVRGPAAGHALLTTVEDPTGTRVLGTLNNCAGGTTPWGTVLSGEENFNQYFKGRGTAEEKLGTLGIELHARMPARGNDGRTTYSPVRFVGVDGPRWFLRGVLSGRAAVEDSAAEPLMTFLRQAIVVRGSEARAPRELLELTIPQELLQQAEANAQPVDDKPGSVDDLKPFERGPEITEVR